MKEPTFLLQKGQVMTAEKVACSLSNFPITYCSYDAIDTLDPKESLCSYIPVGSVEFTERYASHVGISLPINLSYTHPVPEFIQRKIRAGKFKDASLGEFVKPFEKIKLFTGNVKSKLLGEVGDEEEVWICEPVAFESEFRFYIHNYVNKWEILGWSRYDGLSVVNPDPDLELVSRLAGKVFEDLGPNAYSIDIGWRPDLCKYDVVELNDAWALGYYNCSDPQSKPPTGSQYADMLHSRWLQIVFCNII